MYTVLLEVFMLKRVVVLYYMYMYCNSLIPRSLPQWIVLYFVNCSLSHCFPLMLLYTFMCMPTWSTHSPAHRELLDADVIMSPARRSIRIAGRADQMAERPPGSYEVTSLLDLPEELEVAYCPNKALL